MTSTPISSPLTPLEPDHEVWKPIEALEGRYEISTHGRCRSIDRVDYRGRSCRGQLIKPLPDHRGYLRIRPSVQGTASSHRLHRLVAQAFIPNPDNLPQINHKDGDKTNNHVSNLEWVTHHQNTRHAIANGLFVKLGSGAASYTFKGPVKVFDATGKHVDTLFGNADMAAKGYNGQNISSCIHGRRKTHRGMTFKRDQTT